jgi:hypothetical protein
MECINFIVMAGLVPAIHVFAGVYQDVDARHKAGHDDIDRTLAAELRYIESGWRAWIG